MWVLLTATNRNKQGQTASINRMSGGLLEPGLTQNKGARGEFVRSLVINHIYWQQAERKKWEKCCWNKELAVTCDFWVHGGIKAIVTTSWRSWIVAVVTFKTSNILIWKANRAEMNVNILLHAKPLHIRLQALWLTLPEYFSRQRYHVDNVEVN